MLSRDDPACWLCGKVKEWNMQKLASFIGAIALSSLLFSVTLT